MGSRAPRRRPSLVLLAMGVALLAQLCDAGDDQEWRRARVVDAVRHAWGGYASRAWGKDELRPLTGDGINNFGGMGATIVDSIGALYTMGLIQEYEAARQWIKLEFKPHLAGEVVVFETVIRVLAGLVSTFQLTNDALFLDRAEKLAILLAPAFDSPTGIPYAKCNLLEQVCYANNPGRTNTGASAVLAEAGTIALEYRALAAHSDIPQVIALRAKAENVLHLIKNAILDRGAKGLAPSKISVETGKFTTNYVTVGAPSDSYYEYLGKTWVQGGYQEDQFRNMLVDWVDDMQANLVTETDAGDTMVFEMGGEQIIPKMDHFSCYIPGVLSITADHLNDSVRRDHWITLAERLTETCNNMYSRSPSGLSAENIRVHRSKWLMNGGYELRPEALEAMFFMWRRTHDGKYRDWAWKILLQIEKYCKTDYGYSTLERARSIKPVKLDTMHSFLISETFRYLFLIFSEDSLLPLDKYVFNTEAHPLLIMPSLGSECTASEEGQCAAQSCHR